MTLCKCGCEKEVKVGNKWIQGHHTRCFSEETKEKMSESKKGNQNAKGYKHPERIKKAISKRLIGNKFGKGNKGHFHSEKTRKKISEALKGGHLSEVTKKKIGLGNKGKIISEETRQKLSKINRGSKNPRFKHGKRSILRQHHKHKKQECIFGCESKFYDLHHEPKMLYKDILEWEGRLVNLCVSCHRKIHYKTLKLPDNVGIKWTKKDTEEIFRGRE